MPRRNLVPLVLLGVLAVLGLAFAVLGASSAPSGATLTVQNGSTKTFGSPTGSTSFAMDLVASVSTSSGTGTASQVRQIHYVPPRHMAVYQVTSSTTRLVGLLSPAAITCALSSYTSIVGGSTPWTPDGTSYTRTESLADYTARVPDVSSTTCQPHPSMLHGSVRERAGVRAGYLVGIRLTVDVPAQRLANGTAALSGTEGEALVMIAIDGTPTRHLGS
jgi:hypothetical protein